MAIYKTFDEIARAYKRVSLAKDFLDNMAGTEGQKLIKEQYKFLEGETQGYFSLSKLFLVYLEEFRQNKTYFDNSTITGFIRAFNINKMSTVPARITSVGLLTLPKLFIIKNEFIIAKQFNSLYLYDFKILKDWSVSPTPFPHEELRTIISELVNETTTDK